MLQPSIYRYIGGSCERLGDENAMKILLIGNMTDRRCGFANFTSQMVTALLRANADVTPWDGTYSTVYHRREQGHAHAGFFPPGVEDYDVVHIIWNAMTMNHYSAAPWDRLLEAGRVTSWWDGGPSDAYCPFLSWMQVRWAAYENEDRIYCPYPVPDWVDDLPEPAEEFTVGASSVRGDGVDEIRMVCQDRGWKMNLPTPGAWIPMEEEVRRLARSTVNVCWYNTPDIWKDRASAPSMLIASKRPLLINQDSLVAHLHHYSDIYHGKRFPIREGPGMLECLDALYKNPARQCPNQAFEDLSWTKAATLFLKTWEDSR